MAGYSGTSLPKKLGIAEGDRVAFPREPQGFREALGELPEGVEVRGRARGPLDVIDITEDVVRDEGVSRGLVDNKVCAIDDTWSGLRLVIRLRDRPVRR